MNPTAPREIFRVQHNPLRTIKVRYFCEGDRAGLDVIIVDSNPAKVSTVLRAYNPGEVTIWFLQNSGKNVKAWKTAYWDSGLGEKDFKRPAPPAAPKPAPQPEPEKPRPRGMHPKAWGAIQRAFADSGLPPFRIVQTCTGALGARVAASAGTHDADGKLPGGEPFSVSVDLSVWKIRGVVRWSEAHIRWALYNLADEGFACWYRHTGSFAKNLHIHGLYLPIHMKLVSQNQAVDFLNGRTGLVGHAREGFWTPPKALDAKLTALFLGANPECRGRV